MGKVIIYIGTSLDGYIADLQDDVSWLEAFGKTGEDYGYGTFMQTVGAIVMGRRSYTESLLHPERIIRDIPVYVLSKQTLDVSSTPNTVCVSQDISTFIHDIQAKTDKNIFVLGGGVTVSRLLSAGLVDEIIQFVAPVILGNGIPLYPSGTRFMQLELLESVSYLTGMVKFHYRVLPNPPPFQKK